MHTRVEAVGNYRFYDLDTLHNVSDCVCFLGSVQ